MTWKYHPDREGIISETHARPSQSIMGPAVILHLAFRATEDVCDAFFKVLARENNKTEARHQTGCIDGIVMKLERHTEFMSCTLFQELHDKQQESNLLEFFKNWLPIEKIEILTTLKLTLVKSAREMLKRLPPEHRIFGGRIRNGIEVRSNFRPDEDGIINFAIFAKGLSGEEIGRRLQRLMEMETYRTMTLLGLPKARRAGVMLSEYEIALAEYKLPSNGKTKFETDDTLFKKLSELSEKNSALMTETRYRFAASRAYYSLFQQRIMSLEEEKVGDVQTMSGFLRSRLEPAMATIESTAKRQETITDDLSQALVLLRTRIELSLNKGNQALLRSMDKRHDQQLKISQTVEGLSIVAITYYAVGLFSYLLKALATQSWMPFSTTLLTAISVPIIFGLVFVSLRKLRRNWEEHSQSD